MRSSWGKFTVLGDSELEDWITRAMDRIEQRCRMALRGFEVDALLLMGGYGRGEGGVLEENGRQRPHNNFDFLLITPGRSRSAHDELHRVLGKTFDRLSEELGIGIDFGITTRHTLQYSPCLVIWYDVRHGHKVLIGPDDYMDGFSYFTVENIEPLDALALLVNRGTLFIINRVLLSQLSPLNAESSKIFIKHVIKAIIGYGDALLFFLGDYHWSYREKGRRMAARDDVSEKFRKLYAEALDFRFRPRYAEYAARADEAWLSSVIAACESVHLRCEQIRLDKPGLAWNDYIESFYRSVLIDKFTSARSWARKLLNAGKTSACPLEGLSLGARVGFRAAGPRGTLLATFPFVAYDGIDDKAAREARLILGASDAVDARECFLAHWSRAGDTNFARSLRAMGIVLDLERKRDDLHNGRCPSHVVENA